MVIYFFFQEYQKYSPYFFQMTKDGICEEAWDFDPYSIEDILEWGGHPCAGVDWIDWGSGGLGWLHKYSAKGNEVTIKGAEIDLKSAISLSRVSKRFTRISTWTFFAVADIGVIEVSFV